jgi:hypothetical protein
LFEIKEKEVTADWGLLHNGDPYSIIHKCSPTIIGVMIFGFITRGIDLKYA